jgi:DNA polymerase I-like protein with 3'-5' exonuclease and polymerase domains
MESRDKTLVQQYWDRYDIHGDWTERTMRIYPGFFAEGVKAVAKDKDLFKAYRNKVKNEFVFPSLFGAHASSLAGYMNIPQDVVERMHEEFYDQYPGVQKWQLGCWDYYRKHGHVTGLSGFRRRAPIERNQLINAPIQADEALIVCDAWYRLSQRDIPYHPNLMVHDDLTFIWSNREIEKYVPVVVADMLYTEHEWVKVVPLGVEMKIGDDWATQKAVAEFFSDASNKGSDPMGGSWTDGTGWTAVDKARKVPK